MMKFNKQDKSVLLLHSAIMTLFLIIYMVFLIPNYSATIFHDDFSSYKAVIGLSLFIINIGFSAIISGEKYFFRLVWSIISVQFLYGEIVYYIFNDVPVTVSILSLVFCIVVLLLSNCKIPEPISKMNIGTKYLKILTICLFIPFLVYLPYIDLSNLLFKNIYETREIFRVVALRPITYLIAPLTRVLLPIILVEDLKEKNYKSLLFFLLLFIYIYLCGAFKSVFFGVAFVFLFSYGNYKQKEKIYLSGFGGYSVMSLFTMIVLKNNLFINFIRRFIFIPASMNEVYRSHFVGNWTYFRHSGLSLGLFGNPYGSLPYYIGEQVIGKPGLSANTGFIIEGYSSLGIFGSILLITLMVSFFYFVARMRFPQRYFGIVFMFIYYFNNSHISTLLLTHGLLFFIIVVLIVNLDSHQRKKENI